MSTSNINSGFDLLPNEIKLRIFSHLAVKDVVAASKVNRAWKVILERDYIWTPFYKLLFEFSETTEKLKSAVINKIISLKKTVTVDKKADGAFAHIYLSRLGFSSLQSAHSCAKNITQEEEMNNPYEKSGLYYQLGFEYLKNNLLQEAEVAVIEMSPHHSTRGIIAYNLQRRYLAMNNPQKAFSVMQYIKEDQMEASMSLSLFMQAAEKANNIDIAFQALKACKNFSCWSACVRDFANFLRENEDFAKFELLNSLYPEACTENSGFWDVQYYIYTHQLNKAEQVAHAINDLSIKWRVFDEIEAFYNRSGNLQEAQRIHEIKYKFWF